jgi:toxin ParE1/3/4
MARVVKRVAAKRDLTDHFVFLGENASVDVARRFLHACNVSFQALAQMPELGTQRSFRNPHFSSVRVWPVKGFERYLIFTARLTTALRFSGSSMVPETSNAFFVRAS